MGLWKFRRASLTCAVGAVAKKAIASCGPECGWNTVIPSKALQPAEFVTSDSQKSEEGILAVNPRSSSSSPGWRISSHMTRVQTLPYILLQSCA
jgi:hypothetical protein